jgi:xylan 1,4-beta-xylosidase
LGYFGLINHEVSPEKPVTDGFDSNVFFDDDGSVYLLKHGNQIARLKTDLTGLAEPFRELSAANYPQVGYEGVHLFKYKGIYYLSSAEWNVHSDGKVSYDSMIASAKNIYGPYGNRYCALRYGGHNGYFEGPNNELYATIWCYPDLDEHWQRVSIVKMKLNEKGMFQPAN